MKHLLMIGLTGTLLSAGAYEYQKGESWDRTMEVNRPAVQAEAAKLPLKEQLLLWNNFYQKLAVDFPETKAENWSRTLQQATRFPAMDTARQLYVSPGGNDQNAGSEKFPLASLQGARDKIRSLRQDGKLTGPARVIFKAGIYYINAPVEFTGDDTGTAAMPVSYEGEAGQTVTFDAGMRVSTPWQKEGQLYRTTLVNVPADFRPKQLFVNGERAILARYPNFDPANVNTAGWLYHARRTMLLAGLSETGDWAEFSLNIPQDGVYQISVTGGSAIKEPGKYFNFTIDGKALDSTQLKASGHFRRVAESNLGEIKLAAGKHVLKISATGPAGQLNRVHFGGFTLTSGQTAVKVDVAKDRTGGESKSMPLTLLPAEHAPELKPKLVFDFADTERIARWRNEPQRQVFMFGAWGWYSSILNAGEIVQTTRGECTIELVGKEDKALQSGNRFYVFNLLSELDAPGEWYYNYASHDLYYLPRPGEDMAKAEFVLPVTDRIITVGETEVGKSPLAYLAFKNISFRHTDYAEGHLAPRSSEDCAILIQNSRHINVENCVFDNIGGYAVRLSMDTLLCRIDRNVIKRAGAGGVLLRGPWVCRGEVVYDKSPAGKEVSPVGNLVINNDISDSGKLKKYVAGIHNESRPESMRYAPGNVFSHNVIHDMPRNGIFGFFNLGGYVIEYNHIYRVMTETDDGGLIHVCAGEGALQNTSPAIISNNLLHDTDPFRNDDFISGVTGLARLANAHGVYLDDFTSHVTVSNNVISNSRRGGIFLHCGKDNTVVNNVILNDDKIQMAVSYPGDNTVQRNLFVWQTATPYLYGLIKDKNVKTSTSERFDGNLIYHYSQPFTLESGRTWADWQAAGFDQKSIVADPKIVKLDLAHKVLELAPDSPAYQLGFKAIKLDQAGPASNGQ